MMVEDGRGAASVEKPQLPPKRRRRVERLKVYIRCLLFLRNNFIILVCVFGLAVSSTAVSVVRYRQWWDAWKLQRQNEHLSSLKAENGAGKLPDASGGIVPAGVMNGDDEWDESPADAIKEQIPAKPAEILAAYRTLYEENRDLIGWLSIEGTTIDYPVMQTMEEEDYYLWHDFYGRDNSNGCLILDTDSNAGIGTKQQKYFTLDEFGEEQEKPPSTNLIVHGHTMRNGDMFGKLKLYEEEAYGREHHRIRFDSLYEHREYELIAAFYSQVYYSDEEVFKYYKFFQADILEEFDDWYDNIKKLALYDTGVEAQFGDEFITLSCCAYHVENGRFVVVGKRIE